MSNTLAETLPEEYRIEQKFPVDAAGLQEFHDWRVLHGRGFREPHPPRTVNSLYFDSPGLDCYDANLDGMSERLKLRLRWYGTATMPAEARLEIKRKNRSTTIKQVANLALGPRSLGDLAQLVPALRRAAPVDFRPCFDLASRPVLWNRYHRVYLANRRGIRLTVDTDLQAADVLGNRLDAQRLRRDAVHGVIEIKYAPPAADEVRELLGTLQLRHFRHSKYVNGLGGVGW